MTSNLLLTGGPTHPFAATAPLLVDLLAERGVTTDVTSDPHEALALLAAAESGHRPGFDLVTVHALRWSMGQERYAGQRAEHAVTVTDDDLAVLERFVLGICGARADWRSACAMSCTTRSRPTISTAASRPCAIRPSARCRTAPNCTKAMAT